MKKTPICGALSVIIILAMVISQSVIASVIKVEANDKDQPILSTTTIKPIQLGTITCEQKDGKLYIDIVIEISDSERSITLSSSPENIKFTIEYIFKLPGTADNAYAEVWYYDKGGNLHTKKHKDKQQDYENGFIEISPKCYADENFNIHLKGYCSDWWGLTDDDWKVEEKSVMIKPTLPAMPKLSGSGEIKGTNLRPMSRTSVGEDVKIWNSGTTGSKVYWAYSTDRLYGDWDYFPNSDWLTLTVSPDSGELTPEDGEQHIEIWITLSEDVTYVKGHLTFYNTEHPSDYIDIPVDVDKKTKPITTYLQFSEIFNLLRMLLLR